MEQSDILSANHQIVYMSRDNAILVAANLMTFGYRQFATAKIIQSNSLLKKICDDINSKKVLDTNEAAVFTFENLIDSIKVTICFENFMKSILLVNGYVIHKLSKEAYPVLGKEQFERPILFSELTQTQSWEENPNIKTEDEFKWVKNQVKGIGKHTIGMRELCSPKYLEIININQDLIDLCNKYFQYRNNLHYCVEERFSINGNSFSDLTKIIDFVNANVVRLQNEIVDILKKGDMYKASKINY